MLVLWRIYIYVTTPVIMNRITISSIFLIVISMVLPTSAIMFASGQSTDNSGSSSTGGETTTTTDDNNAAVSSSNGGSTAINNTGNVQGVDVNVILDLHNRARAEVGVPPLTWSDTLAASAQSWAEHLATINEMVHSSGQPYGENLAGWTHGCGLASLVPPLDYNNGVCPGDTLRTMVMSW